MVEVFSIDSEAKVGSNREVNRGEFQEPAFWIDVLANRPTLRWINGFHRKISRDRIHYVELALQGATGEYDSTMNNILKLDPSRTFKATYDIIHGFFTDRKLGERVRYGKSFMDVVREEPEEVQKRLAKTTGEITRKPSDVAEVVMGIFQEHPQDFWHAVHTNEYLRQRYASEGDMNAYITHKLLKTLYSDAEIEALGKEGITQRRIWDVKRDEILTRYADKQKTLTPMEYNLIGVALNIVKEQQVGSTKELIPLLAQRMGLSESAIRSLLYNRGGPMRKLFTPEELEQRGVSVTLMTLLQKKHPAVMTILQEEKEHLDQFEMVQETLNTMSFEENERDTIHKIAENHRIKRADEHKLQSLFIKGLQYLYNPEELKKFYQPALIDTTTPINEAEMNVVLSTPK